MSKKKRIVSKNQQQKKLSDREFLKEVLEDLTEEGQVLSVSLFTNIPYRCLIISQIKKLNLLKESLHHKSDIFKTNQVNEVKN